MGKINQFINSGGTETTKSEGEKTKDWHQVLMNTPHLVPVTLSTLIQPLYHLPHHIRCHSDVKHMQTIRFYYQPQPINLTNIGAGITKSYSSLTFSQ